MQPKNTTTPHSAPYVMHVNALPRAGVVGGVRGAEAIFVAAHHRVVRIGSWFRDTPMRQFGRPPVAHKLTRQSRGRECAA